MNWKWRLENSAGKPVVCDIELVDLGATSSFGSQGDAETWLGDHWRDLASLGIAQVTLMEESREVYGPMSLSLPEG